MDFFAAKLRWVRAGPCPCRARVRVRVVEFSYYATGSTGVALDDVEGCRARWCRAALQAVPAVGRRVAGRRRRFLVEVAERQVPVSVGGIDRPPERRRSGPRRVPGRALQRVVVGTEDGRRRGDGRSATVEALRRLGAVGGRSSAPRFLIAAVARPAHLVVVVVVRGQRPVSARGSDVRWSGAERVVIGGVGDRSESGGVVSSVEMPLLARWRQLAGAMIHCSTTPQFPRQVRVEPRTSALNMTTNDLEF